MILQIAQPHLCVDSDTVEVEDAEEEEEDVIVTKENINSETVGEQLQFWRSAAIKMESSKLGTSSGLIELMNMIRRLEIMHHTLNNKQSKVTNYFKE